MCTKLHAFLQATFPTEYAQRAAETALEEAELHAAAPDLSAVHAAASTPQHPSESDFGCDACGQLLLHPAVLNCGHVVCRSPGCLRRLAAGGAAGECACAKCGAISPQTPAVCRQLEELIAASFPASLARRQEQERQAAPSAGGAPAPAPAQPPADQPPQAAAPAPASDEQGGAAPPPQPPSQPPSQPQPRRHVDLAALLASPQFLATYTHFGVGCDVCGQYPIVGRRYRCLDCPESIGFDLCGVCHDRGPASLVGRFNQHHDAAHEMEEKRPRVTSMHLLQAANPELSFDQLTQLLEMSVNWVQEGPAAAGDARDAAGGSGSGSDEADEGGGPSEATQAAAGGHGSGSGSDEADEAGQGGGPSEAGQADAQSGGGGAPPAPAALASATREEDPPPVPALRRGPRPAVVPTAVWPSPSAPPDATAQP